MRSHTRRVLRRTLTPLVSCILVMGALLVPAAAQAAMAVSDIETRVYGSDVSITWTTDSSGSSEVSIARDDTTAFNATGTIKSANTSQALGNRHSSTVRDLIPGEYFVRVRSTGTAGSVISPAVRFVVGGANTAAPVSNVITDGTVTAMHTYQGETWLAGAFTHVGAYTGSLVSLGATDGAQAPGIPVADGSVEVIEPDGLDGYYVGGDFRHIGGYERNGFAHILPDGGIDPSFDPGLGANGVVRDIAVSGTKVFLAGSFTSINGVGRNRIAAVDRTTGALLPGIDPAGGFAGTVLTIEIVGTNLWAGGTFTSYQSQTRNRIAILDTTLPSLPALSWDPGVVGPRVNDIEATGMVVLVGGSFTSYGGLPASNIAAASKTTAGFQGTIDADGEVLSIAVPGDGKTYVGGAFSVLGGHSTRGLGVLDGLTNGVNAGFVSKFAPGTIVRDVDVSAGTIYAAGSFDAYDTHPTHAVAAIGPSGAAVTSFGAIRGIDTSATASTIAAVNGRVLVGGTFRMFDSTARNGLAKVTTATGEVDQTFRVGNGISGGTGTINAIQRTENATGQGVVYVAGNFTTYDGSTGRANIVKLFAEDGAFASGSRDITFAFTGGGANNTINALAVSPTGYGVIIGGDFTSWRGAPAGRIAFVSEIGALQTSFNPPDPSHGVTSLLTVGARVFAGGHFTQVGAMAQNGVAAFDLATGEYDVDFLRFGANDEYAGAGSNVSELAASPDGASLYVAGEFTSVQGVTQNRIAKVDLSTDELDLRFNPRHDATSGFNDKVTSLALAGNRLYAGGPFTKYNGVDRGGFAAVSTTSGSLDRTFSPVLDGPIEALTAYDDYALIGGSFTTIDGQPRRGVSLMRRTVDTTKPVARVYSITEPAPTSPVDGVFAKSLLHVVVNPTVANPTFTMKFLSHDRAVSTARVPGTTSGLDRIDWPTIPAARGTWGPTSATTTAAPTGLDLDCWDSLEPGTASAAHDYDEAIDWVDGKRPDVTPSLPAILANLATEPTPPNGIDRGVMSCEWNGYVSVPETAAGDYRFRSRSDGGFRATVQGLGGLAAPWTSVNDDWDVPGDELSDASGLIAFGASGARPLRAQWHSNGGVGIAGLEWDPPGVDSWRTVPAQAYASDVYYSRQFTLTNGAGATDGTSTIQIVSSDQAANTTAENFEVSTDGSKPNATVVSTTPAVGTSNDNSVRITIPAPGVDVGEAGILNRELQRRARAVDASGACTGAAGGWTTLQTWPATVPATFDDAVLPDGCYQYQFVARDNVGNQRETAQVGVTDPNIDWIRIDATAPAAPTGVVDGGPLDSEIAVVTDKAKAAWTASTAADVVRYDVCLSTTQTCSGPDIVHGWSSVGLATSAALTGLSMQDGSTYFFTVRSVDAAGNVDVAASNGFVVNTTPASVNPPTGPGRGNIVLSGVLDPLLTLTGTLGVLELKVIDVDNPTRQDSPCSATITGASWSCIWETTSADDGNWQLSVVALSVIGGSGLPLVQGLPLTVDNSPPTHTGVRIDEAVNPQWSHVGAAPNTVWVNPAHGGAIDVSVAASDPLGVSFRFPGFGPGYGWTPATPTTNGSGTLRYSWIDGASQPTEGSPLTGSVYLKDALTNDTTTSFFVHADTTPPASGTIDQHPGVVSTPDVTVVAGVDAGSGTATFHVERESAPLLDADTCDTTGWRSDWATVSLPDLGVTRGQCYRYKLVTVDNVGNVREDVAGGAVVISDYAIIPTSNLDIAEGGVTGSYSIRLHRAPTSDVTLDITSDAGQVRLYDAGDQPITQLVFTSTNWATTQIVYVSAVDDAVDESDPHASLISHAISTADPNYAALAPIVVSASITDNDVAAVLVAATGGLDLDESDPIGRTFTVRLATQPVGGDVTISLPGTAQASVAPGELTFTDQDWSTPRTVTAVAVDDALVEGPHSTLLQASADSDDPTYDDIGVPAVTARIADNDEAGIEVEEPATPLLAEADVARTANYRVRLTAEPRHPVTIDVADALGQLEVLPASITIQPADWHTWIDVVVRARQDAVAEPNPHVSRVVFTPSGLDGKFTALPPLAYDQEIVEDDVAAYVATLGASWTRGDAGVLKVSENDGSGATIAFAPMTAPNAAITVTPALSHSDRFTVSPTSATIEAGAPQTVTFTVRPIDDTVDAADLAATISWNTSTSEAMYSSVRLDDTAFTIVDDEVTPVDRVVREAVTPPAGGTTPSRDPVKPRETTPTPDAQTPTNDTPATPVADAPTAGTPTPDAATPLQPQDAVPAESTTDTPAPEARPRDEAPVAAKPKEHRSNAARAKEWIKHNKGAATGAGIAGIALAGAAAKALAAKGLAGMFQGIPGIENLSDHVRHLRPRRFRKDAERLKKLRNKSRSRNGTDKLREVRRRRRRREEDPMSEIFDRLDGNYRTDGTDLLDRLEGNTPTNRVDILDMHDAASDAGFELDLDDIDGRAA